MAVDTSASTSAAPRRRPRLRGVPLRRARPLPPGRDAARGRDGARRRSQRAARHAGPAAPPRSAGAGAARRASSSPAACSTWQLELPAYALTGHHTLELVVGREDHRPVPLPGRGVRPRPDRRSRSRRRGGAGRPAHVRGGARLPVRRAGGRPAGRDPGAAGRDALRPQGVRGLHLPQRRAQAGRPRDPDRAGQARRRGPREFAVEVPAGLRDAAGARGRDHGRGCRSRAGAASPRSRGCGSIPIPITWGCGASARASGPGPGGLARVRGGDAGRQADDRRALRAELFEDRWNTVLRRMPSGLVPLRVDARPGAGRPAGARRRAERGARSTSRRRDYGSYRVVLTDPDSGARASSIFYAAGWGFRRGRWRTPRALELALDKDGTRRASARAPGAGALLRQAAAHRRARAACCDWRDPRPRPATPPRSRSRCSRDYRPNAYVTATLVRSAGTWSPARPAAPSERSPLSVDRGEPPRGRDRGARGDAARTHARDRGARRAGRDA